MRRRSRHTYESAIEIGGEFIRTETNEAISDFSLVTTPADREFLGFDQISLSQAPDVEALVQELQQVISALESE
jgi:hypothetical protein